MEPHRHLGGDAPRINFKYIEDTFDQTVPAGLGTAAVGIALTATRRDHVHPLGGLSAGTISVSAGGTGATTLTANAVVIAEGTAAFQAVGPGITGQVFTSNGAGINPSFQAFAVSGYEVVSASAAGPNGANATVLITVSCTTGKKVLGGGGQSDVRVHNFMSESYPSTIFSWSARYSNDETASGANTITAWAICAAI